MDQLDISISPLIAGLGIGGIAVALALQPTLANFFAGTYLVGDTVIMPGDFIELESGLRGYVVEIGWRSTRLRTPFNNLVVIPNSRLADSILTNYYGPSMEIGVMVEAGVSYSSDLAHVERVAIEVAQEVIDAIPESDKNFAPWFGFERFGDSNIDFWIWVQATDRLSSFRMKTELMKLLHSRFKQEGIEIQTYCAIIACLLISLWTGRKPTLRTYEMICYYFTGLADEEELQAHISKLPPADA